jgi:hypothetical protein
LVINKCKFRTLPPTAAHMAGVDPSVSFVTSTKASLSEHPQPSN